MPQILAPDNISNIAIASATTITMPASNLGKQVRITVGGQQYALSSAITLNLASFGPNGLDAGVIAANSVYYVYAIKVSGVLGLVASLNGPGTGPIGYLSWKLVGQFKTATASAVIDLIYSFGQASPSDYGAVSGNAGYPGNNTGAIATAGKIGEILTFPIRTVTTTGGGWAVNTTPLVTLTPGEWMIHSFGSSGSNTGLQFTQLQISDSLTGGSGGIFPVNAVMSQITTTVGTQYALFSVPILVVGANKPLYAQAITSGAVASPTVGGYAVRIA